MENNQNAVTQTEQKTEETVTETVTKTDDVEVKTFTQEEVNAILAKERKKMPSKEDMDAFNSWKESQKTETEKALEKDKEIERLKGENAQLLNANSVANSNVNTKFQKFVLSEVSGMEGNFEENLKSYLKDNPQFLNSSETKETKTTGFSQNNTNKMVSEEKAYLDKKYADNPYYKK